MGILSNLNNVFIGKSYAIENIEKREELILNRIEKYYNKTNFKEENKLDSTYILHGIKSELYKEYMAALKDNKPNVYKYFFEDKTDDDVFCRKVDNAITTLYNLFSQVNTFSKKSNVSSYKTQYERAQESVDRIYNLYEEVFVSNKKTRKK
ncbi:MAG: hypothetical protein J5634_01145 [Bacilli bacterium]|nr:hypothetical protein [Bacilli bacterium]